MTITQLEGGTPRGGTLARLKELNLSPAEALLTQSNDVQLKSLSSGQIAGAREFKAGALEDIQGLQSADGFPFPFPFPPIPGGDGPPPIPGTNPLDPDFSKYEPTDIMREQDPEAYTAFSRLPPDSQNEFAALVRSMGFERPMIGGLGGLLGGALQQQHTGGFLGGLGGAVGRTGHPTQPQDIKPRINQSLLNLLKSGKLTQKDSEGHTLLQNLTQLSQQEMGPNMDRKAIFRELCGQLDDPKRINQGSRNTCAPTTIQYLQATRDPAEYARLVIGLTSKEGTVTMRNGDTLARDKGSVGMDNSGRGTIDRLYQSAMMEYADGDDEYDNRTDQHTTNTDSTYTGLSNQDSERALDALFGDKYDSFRVNNQTPEGRADAENRLRQALNRGEQIPVSLHWRVDNQGQERNHMLLVVGMTDSTVLLRNPWGSWDDGTGTGPQREVVDGGGTIEMSKEEFFSRCYNMHIPKVEG